MKSRNKNSQFTNSIEYVNAQEVADYYGVTLETVKEWIKSRKISGKQSEENSDQYWVVKEEFIYLKNRRDQDETEKIIQELLGDDYSEDLEVELDEDI